MEKNKRYNSCLALGGLALLGAICLPKAQPFGLREGFCILVPALMVALWQGYTLCSVKTIGPVVLFMAVGLLLPR